MMHAHYVRVSDPHVILTVDDRIPASVARSVVRQAMRGFHPEARVRIHIGDAGDKVRCHTHLILQDESRYAWGYGACVRCALQHTISALDKSTHI